MTNAERIAQYNPTQQDWTEDKAITKIQMETITALFIAIENTIAGQAHPELIESISECRDKVLDTLQTFIAWFWPSQLHRERLN